jgi:DNA polymerase III delta prime subunit
MSDFKSLWCERYRPHKLQDLIVSDHTRSILEGFKSEIPNLLFVGAPGTGKTSTARIIVSDILGCDYLYINASDESGIDMIRSKVVSFAQTKSFDGGMKVVIFDEADGISATAQGALRNIMEEYAKHTRFILTANYKHKIIPAVQSRCQSIDIKPTIEEAVKRCYHILKQEGVVVEGDQKQKFIELVKNTFPDMRKCINELQKNSIEGRLNIKETTVPNSLLKYIHECIMNGETLELRRHIIGVEDTFYGDYDNLLKEYLNYLYEQDVEVIKKKTMIAIIADHLYRAVLVLDREINFFACTINLERV